MPLTDQVQDNAAVDISNVLAGRGLIPLLSHHPHSADLPKNALTIDTSAEPLFRSSPRLAASAHLLNSRPTRNGQAPSLAVATSAEPLIRSSPRLAACARFIEPRPVEFRYSRWAPV